MSDDVINALFEKLDSLGQKMDGHREMISDLQVGQARLATQIALQKACSRPDLCIALDERLSSIETAHSEQKGAWKVILAISSGVSAVVGLLIQYLSGK